MQLSPLSAAAAATQQGSKAPCSITLSWTTFLDNVSPWKPTVLKHHVYPGLDGYVWQGSLVLQRGWGCTKILSDQFQESTQRLISNKEPEAGRPNPGVPPASSTLLRIHWAPWLEGQDTALLHFQEAWTFCLAVAFISLSSLWSYCSHTVANSLCWVSQQIQLLEYLLCQLCGCWICM